MANIKLLSELDQLEPTFEQLADQFAAKATKSILEPSPDGLQVFEELAQKSRKPIDPDR